MGGSRGDMDCVGRRTRRKWDEYYEKLYKREDLKCDVAGGSEKRVKKNSEPAIVDEEIHETVDSSKRECDDVVIEERGELEEDDGGGDADVEILGSKDEDEDEYGGGGGGGILVKDEDDDDGIEILNEEDDESVSSLNDGENEARGFEELQAGGGEDDDGGGGGILKRDEDESEGGGIMVKEEYEDDDGIVFLRIEKEGDDSVSSLNKGGEEAKGFENIAECSRDNAQTGDSQESESGSESESESSSDEDMDELSDDDDYKGDESSSSESSEEMQSHVNGENENLVKEREGKLPDKVEDDDDDRKSRRTDKLHEECSSPASAMDEELEPSNDVEKFFSTREAKSKVEEANFSNKKSNSVRDFDLIKILVDSIDSLKHKQYTIDEKALAENILPLKFKFEDEEAPPPPEKSEWEKDIDSMFFDLELALMEAEADSSGFSKMGDEDSKATEKIEESQAVLCRRGKHVAILDEEIGIICEFCLAVIMDIKHVLPPFITPAPSRQSRKAYDYDESPGSLFSDFLFQESASGGTDSTSCTRGTVWDLIPGVRKELYEHQREGFKFMWKNIAGSIMIEELKQTLPDDARGCIMSHAPGTGKTRLAIVFLQTFMKMYPMCSPMIIAPRGMLLTWEGEFKKWNFNVAFHNLNKNELSGKENAAATGLLEQAGSGGLSRDCIRLLKLYSWATGGSILGVSYPLFVKLVEENGRKHDMKIREVLLERPGLLVLDEGHTPRNEKSKIWKALSKVSTRRRIILSGTPFQNSLQELCNTICVANPKFASQVGHRRYGRLTNCPDVNRDEAMRLKAMLAPYVHVHKGTILKQSLPGLRHTLVFLHPTESQKILLKIAWKEKKFFHRSMMISLLSVHPSIDAEEEGRRAQNSKREAAKVDIDEGVKLMFLMKLIQLSDALGERVLVFSQYRGSLLFIQDQLKSNFSWNKGIEVLYMDGDLEDKKRQDSISSFNDDASEVKVLLASVKACSEGINLIGASRVVLLDTLWNPSMEKQAICRAYRIGQKKVVHVYRLFTTGVEIRLGQLRCQLHKEQVSRWLFSLGEEQGCLGDKPAAADKVLDAMLELDSFKHIFDKVLSQPNESELMKTFGLFE